MSLTSNVFISCPMKAIVTVLNSQKARKKLAETSLNCDIHVLTEEQYNINEQRVFRCMFHEKLVDFIMKIVNFFNKENKRYCRYGR